MRSRSFGLLFLSSLVAACAAPHPVIPHPAASRLATRFAQAERADQEGAPAEALEAYLALLETAVRSPEADGSFSAAVASIDALTGRRFLPLEDLDDSAAVAWRVPEGPAIVLRRLAALHQEAGPNAGFLRPLLASAATRLAMHDADAAGAALWRERSGCVREASVIGPIVAFGLDAIASPLPFEAPGAPLPGVLPPAAPLLPELHPQVVQADGCVIPLRSETARSGLRAVVVDVNVPRPQTVWVGLASTMAAAVSIGGKQAIIRGFEAGGGTVVRIAGTSASAGTLRIVVRAALRDDGEGVSLQVVGEDGLPLASHAPRPSDLATAGVDRSFELRLGASPGDTAMLGLAGSALLALGDARRAEVLLERTALQADVPVSVLLAYGRALSQDSVLPEARRWERAREVWERARKRMPLSWEAALGHAWLAGQRKGQGEARVQSVLALRELFPDGTPRHPMIDVFVSLMAARAKMPDVAVEAKAIVDLALGKAPLTVALEGAVLSRDPAAQAKRACSVPGRDQSSLDCFRALSEIGAVDEAVAELERLRGLRAAPHSLLPLEAALHASRNNASAALRAYETMPPGLRSFASLAPLVASDAAAVLLRVDRDLPSANGELTTAFDLQIAATRDLARAFDERGAAVVAADRKDSTRSSAGLLVLEHRETYELVPSGVIHYLIHDVRRVSGTADVEEAGMVVAPVSIGTDVHRVLRRRVHKRDGRVLEPDDTEQAEQRNADLSQLQPGDYVEQLVVGLALPGLSGRFVVDTPDLMPERAAVRSASIEVKFPSSIKLDRWAHPLLVQAPARREGRSTVWRWTLDDKPPRRLEVGVPPMESQVRVTFGDESTGSIAAAIRDALAAMSATDDTVAEFAGTTVGGSRPVTPDSLSKVVEAVGARVRASNAAALSDTAAVMSSGSQRTTARTVLESGHGSRTLLAYEMLRSIGVRSEIVVAEDGPFASAPTFPAHSGRYAHPLLVATLPNAGMAGGREVWMDLDVSGPPLPPGVVSDDVQGKFALRATGTVSEVPKAGRTDRGDEVEVRLVLDAGGRASGTVTLLLRGRAAQELADSFQTTVGAERRELLRGVVLAWVPRADIDTVALESKEGAWEVQVRATFTIPGFAQPEGTWMRLPGVMPLHEVGAQPGASTVVGRFATEGVRESVLGVDGDWGYRLHRRIELPPGWRFSAAGSEAEVADERLSAKRESRIAGQVIDEQFALRITAGTVEPGRYEGFAEAARRVDDAFMATVRVEKGEEK